MQMTKKFTRKSAPNGEPPDDELMPDGRPNPAYIRRGDVTLGELTKMVSDLERSLDVLRSEVGVLRGRGTKTVYMDGYKKGALASNELAKFVRNLRYAVANTLR